MRRLAVWLFVLLLVALAVFSWSTPVIFGLYIGLLVPVIGFHWYYSCRDCTNLACAINSASDEFFLGRRRREIPPDASYSDVKARIAGMPLVFTVGIGFYGAFSADWRAGLGCTALLVAAATSYARVTCVSCTNECPANQNQDYWDWKGEQTE